MCMLNKAWTEVMFIASARQADSWLECAVRAMQSWTGQMGSKGHRENSPVYVIRIRRCNLERDMRPFARLSPSPVDECQVKNDSAPVNVRDLSLLEVQAARNRNETA